MYLYVLITSWVKMSLHRIVKSAASGLETTFTSDTIVCFTWNSIVQVRMV